MSCFMEKAIEEAVKGIKMNHGGPFGAVIVHKGKILAGDHNRVISSYDPTAHAEVNVIRKASSLLKSFNLSECILYSTCEPCPMCLSAVYWSRIETLYYGCTRWDAEAIGFDDSLFYRILSSQGDDIGMRMFKVEREACLEVFNVWKKKSDKTSY